MLNDPGVGRVSVLNDPGTIGPGVEVGGSLCLTTQAPLGQGLRWGISGTPAKFGIKVVHRLET